MRNSVCTGSVIHNRITPKPHRFKYQMSWCLFDLDSIEDLFKKTKLWSLNKFNIVSLRNKDYINSETCSIRSKVVEYLKSHTHYDFNGQILLFTHPRFLGFGFNSVNFYFCYEDNQLLYILSEINNTPWKQKHVYLHEINQSDNSQPTAHEFDFQKEFHISPFADMDIDYHWKFNINEENLLVHMQLSNDNITIMNVNLNTTIKPVLKNDLIKWTFKKPFQALKMLSGIYWQAFKLWAKKTPIYTNPTTKEIEQ